MKINNKVSGAKMESSLLKSRPATNLLVIKDNIIPGVQDTVHVRGIIKMHNKQTLIYFLINLAYKALN